MSSAKAALKRSPRLVRPASPVTPAQILEALPHAVMVVGPHHRVLAANYAAEEFFGTSRVILEKTPLTKLLPATHPVFAMIARVRQSGMSIAAHDLVLESPRLARRGCTILAAPLTDHPAEVLLTFQDDSTARVLDQQISTRTAARSLTGMAAILAHEVKNPLSGIRGAAQLLESSVPTPDQELAVLIREEADRIRAMIERMECFGDKQPPHQAVNIHHVLAHVRKIAASGFAAGVRFVEHYDPSLPSVLGDRDPLVQAVLNLVKNAAEAIFEAGQTAGEIQLITRYQQGARLFTPTSPTGAKLPILVVVRDNGAGIAEEIKPYLFEPFISTKASLSGLGLALVTKIIADHGGLIDVDSQPGRTEFRLHLPVCFDPVEGIA